jgi:hypothetical protein
MRPRRPTIAIGAPIALIAGLAVFAVLRCASVWEELPPVLMSHFDARGHADGFMRRESFFPMFAALCGIPVFLLLAIPRLVGALPATVLNIPNRDYWLPERRSQVQHKLGVFAAWSAAGVTALLVGVLELTLRANLAREPLSSAWWMLVVGYLLGTGLSLVWLARAFRVPATARS